MTFRVQRLLLGFFLLFTFIGFAGCKDPVFEKCESVCKFTRACMAGKNIFLPKNMENEFNIQCMDGCTRFQAEILPCFDQAGNSCEKTMQCVLQTGVME